MAVDVVGPVFVSPADGIYRLGDEQTALYVLEDGPHLTMVDAGLPVHARQLPALLGAIGRTLEAVVAVLLTCNHPDDLGAAERVGAQASARRS